MLQLFIKTFEYYIILNKFRQQKILKQIYNAQKNTISLYVFKNVYINYLKPILKVISTL